MTEHDGGAARARRPWHWLAALPALFLLAGIPAANRVEPYVLGLPFLLFWILLWVLATSGAMALIYRLDQRRDRAESAAGPLPAAGDEQTAR